MYIENNRTLDVIIIGAGFAGLYALHRLRNMGFRCRVFEAGDGVGGTWYWNRYPGAACDIESLEYSYSFSEELEQDWVWTERFARQPEILAYINHVADRFDLRRDIQLETRVTSAVFDSNAARWVVTTNGGDVFSGRFLIMATGCLSVPKGVEYHGLDRFKGQSYFTAYWPKDRVDFTGKRVAIVGTGSSAIQCAPIIAQEAAHLTVFQRTPNFSVPARNRPLTEDEQNAIKAKYRELRRKERNSNLGIDLVLAPETRASAQVSEAERREEFERRWQAGGLYFYTSFVDLFVDQSANEELANFAREKIRAKVDDPKLAELLCPKDHPFGTKRICADTNYYETFNRDNVSLVDVRSNPILEITETGIRTQQEDLDFDCIVFATGFDAMTGAILNINIQGRNGLLLKDKWADGPKTYLGIMTSGFPNLFITTGPQSPSVLYNMVLGNEFHVEWISDCIEHMRRRVLDTVEPEDSAEENWVHTVNTIGDATLFTIANSWYVGANIPGKPRVIMPYLGGFKSYKEKCESVVANGYDGFAFEAL